MARMVAFCSSVTLMTGHYRGRPMQKHLPLPIEGKHFDRWLDLFRATAPEVWPSVGAAHVTAAAEGIAFTMLAHQVRHVRLTSGASQAPQVTSLSRPSDGFYRGPWS